MAFRKHFNYEAAPLSKHRSVVEADSQFELPEME